jgi:hypothetical protein
MNSQGAFRYSLPVLALTACASPSLQTAVPANLVPAGERQVERLSARGLQTYECRATPGGAAGAAWVYVAAALDLFDGNGKPAGRHTFSPPVWEAPDGSKFTGTQKARDLRAPKDASQKSPACSESTPRAVWHRQAAVT